MGYYGFAATRGDRWKKTTVEKGKSKMYSDRSMLELCKGHVLVDLLEQQLVDHQIAIAMFRQGLISWGQVMSIQEAMVDTSDELERRRRILRDTNHR